VLCAGRLVAQARASQTSAAELAGWMVGQAVHLPTRRPAAATGAVVCSLSGAGTEASGRERLVDVNLELRRGEIVAVAGVSGNGQLALAEVMCGTRALRVGTARLGDAPLPPDPARLVALGVARIPEDRQGTGIIGDLPLWENAIAERRRARPFARAGWVDRVAAQTHARRILETFDVRGGGTMARTRSLSGGNMQKLILGRALLAPDGRPPKLIVAHQPTWGLDVGAVAYVQQQLIAARDAGAAVIVISDDLDEVIALGDRIAVMHAGRLSAALPATAWSREAIGLAMAGAPAPGAGTHATA
jgi:simple sugar transport system ATP-binding protein